MKANRDRIRGFLAAGLMSMAACAACAADLGQPIVLVASPDLRGSYRHAALLVVPMGDRHVGFILNRATEATLAKTFPEHAPSSKVVEPIFFGGPEGSNALFALLRRDPGEPSIHLFGDLFMTADGKNIDRIIEQTPNDARYFAGFVGWTPGELAKEIEAGYWYVAAPDAALVFRKDAGSMWQELVTRLGNGHAPRKDLRGI
jgi:putative transcriptional regulator